MIAFDLTRFLRKRRTEQEEKSCEKGRDRYRYFFLLEWNVVREGKL